MADMLHGVHASWLPALEPHRGLIDSIETQLDAAAAGGHPFAPDATQVFRALELPLDSVKVVIIGQDPYPTPGMRWAWPSRCELT